MMEAKNQMSSSCGPVETGFSFHPLGIVGSQVLYLHLEIPSVVSPTHCKASYKGLEMLVPTKNDKLRRL